MGSQTGAAQGLRRRRGFTQWSDPLFSRVLLLVGFDNNSGAAEGPAGSSGITKFGAGGSPSITVASAKWNGYGSNFTTVANGNGWQGTNATTLTAYTVELWVKLTSYGGVNGTGFISRSNGPTQVRQFLGVQSGGTLILDQNNSSGVLTRITGVTTVPTGQWVHVAGVWDGNNMRLYLNGQLESTSTTITSLQTGSTWWLGALDPQNGIFTLPINGDADEFRITSACRYFSNFSPPGGPYPRS